MRGFLVAVALVPLLGGATDSTRPNQTIDPCAERVTAKQFERFTEAVWRLPAWERGKPPAKVIRAQRHKLGCAAGPGHRRAMKRQWRSARAAYFEHRRGELWRVRVTPFYGCTSIGGCGWWPLPAAIVDCESGGYHGHHSGAYGFLDSTWVARGGLKYAPYPGAASVREQQIMAHQLWQEVGETAWECKADGSTRWP